MLIKPFIFNIFLTLWIFSAPSISSKGEHTDIPFNFEAAAFCSVQTALNLSPLEFAKDYSAQSTLFLRASLWQVLMGTTCQLIQEHFQKTGKKSFKRCVNSIKGTGIKKFHDKIQQKCRLRNFTQIKEIHDLARGRIDLESMDDAQEVIKLVIDLGTTFDLKLISITPPRSPVDEKLSWYAYPRYHVLLKDSDNFIVEWQIGPKKLTQFLETEAIKIPRGLKTPKGFHRNLHDVAYKVFQNILNKGKADEKYQSIAKKNDLNGFMNQMKLAMARTTAPFDQFEELFEADLYYFHKKAGEILTDLLYLEGHQALLDLF